MRFSRTFLVTVVLAAIAVAVGVSRDAAATQQPVEMKFACTLKSNGLMRYVSNLNQCKATEDKVTIKPGPITVCVNPDGTTRKIPPYQCQKPGVVLTLPPASGTVYFCAANSTGQLRYVTSPIQCTAIEFPVFVGPNSRPAPTTSTPSVSSIPLGQSAHDNAVVQGDAAGGSPGGTVSFSVCGPLATDSGCASGTPLGAPVPVTPTSGNASTATSISFTPTSPGVYCFRAEYSGASPYTGTADGSSTECFSVTKLSSTTSTTPSTTSITLGQSLTDSATVTGSSAGGAPDGSVSFYICGPLPSAAGCTSTLNPVGSAVTLTAGAGNSSSATSSSLTPSASGTYCFHAAYAGGTNYFGSDDLGNANECFTVNAAPTGTTSTPTSTTLTLGQSITDSALVGGNAAGGPPGGSVTFYVCGPQAGATGCASTSNQVGSPVTLAAGAGNTSSATSSSFTPSAPGTYCFNAVYSGDGNYLGSSDGSSSECFTVNKTPSSTSTAPSSTSITFGQSVTDTATVTGSSAGGAPDGSVNFYICGPLASATGCTSTSTAVGSAVSLTAGAGNTSSATSSSFTPSASGTYCFHAVYSGGTNYSGSNDLGNVNECFTVNAAPTVTVSTPSSTTLTLGGSLTDSAVVTGNSGGPAPTGTVSFYVCFSASTTLTSCSSTSDQVGHSAVGLTPDADPAKADATSDSYMPSATGSYCFYAVYSGDSSYLGSNDGSAGECFTVPANQAPTDIQLSNSSIAENQPSGTDVGTLTTTDPDVGDTHTYTLANTGCGGGPFPDNSSFQIGGGGNDTLQSAASFDFETKSSYTVCVRSTDSGSLSFDKQFTISVTNVNEPPTDISLDNNNIDENKPSGSLVGNLSQVGDPDSGETYTFTLLTSGCSGTFNDSTNFQISGSQLQSAGSFNFENKNSYTICVRVNDPGSPSQTFEKQFTISINDVNDAPVAVADSYSGAIGNTVAVVQTTATGPHVTLTGNSLIANDTDEDVTFPHTLSAVAETVSSTGGGSVQINSDGSFVYTPGVGDKNQDDTFTYHVTDGSLTSAGTATIHIDNFLVWYVDNSSAAATHDGRSSSPLLGLSGLNGAGGSGDSDGPGDYIFLYYGTGASYGSGIPLEANQSLWGEKQGLTVDGDTLVAAGANAPTITNASGVGVGLANGSDVEGLNISGTSGDAVNGSAVTTSMVGTTTAVNISNAGGDGVDLSGAATGNISVAAPIADSAGLNAAVAGRSGGTVAFSGALSDSAAGTGGGVSLSSNTGATINFTGGVAASTTTSPAFSATGGGTVNVTGANNTLATTTATALNIANTTIGASGLTFKKIDSSGGSSTGVILDTTGSSGSLSVTGSGTAGSGGTIANKTGGDGSNTTGVGIYLNSTMSPSFARMQLNDFQNFAIRGTSVNGFTLSDSTINGSNGTSTALDEASVAIDNLTGSGSITNDNISGGVEDDVRVKNTAGSLTSLSITGSTFATTTAATANDALSLIGQTGVTVFNASVTGNSFTRAQGDLYQYTLNTGTGTMHFDSNTVSNNFPTTLPAGGGDINVSSGSLGNGPSLTYTISNNQIYASGTGGQPPNGSVIVAAATPQGSATGTIANNLIGTTGVTQSGGFDAILVDAVKLGVHKVTITGNTIRRYKEAGIRILGVSPAASPGFNMRATVQSNVITEPDSVAFAGIDAEVGADPSDIGTMCVDLGGAGALANSVSNGDPSNFNDINLIQQFATSMILPGYGGAATDDSAVEAFEAARNNGDGTPTVFASHDTTTGDGNPAGSGFLGGANCL